jgi:hypothetical protein
VESYEGPAVIRQANEDVAVTWLMYDTAEPPTLRQGFWGGRFTHPAAVHIAPGDAVLVLPTGETAEIRIQEISFGHGTHGWFAGSGPPPEMPNDEQR